MWGLFRIPIDRLFRRRDLRPVLTVRQLPGFASTVDGCGLNAGVRNDGGSIARGVTVTGTVDGKTIYESERVDVKPGESDLKVKVRLPAAMCEPVPGDGLRPVGRLTFEIWWKEQRVDWCPAQPRLHA